MSEGMEAEDIVPLAYRRAAARAARDRASRASAWTQARRPSSSSAIAPEPRGLLRRRPRLRAGAIVAGRPAKVVHLLPNEASASSSV